MRLSEEGKSVHRSICHTSKQEMPKILLMSRTGSAITGRRVPDQMECPSPLCFPSNSSNLQSHTQNTNQQGQDNPHSANMAQTDFVPLSESHGNMHSIQYPLMTWSPLTGQRTSPPSQSRENSPQSMTPSWLWGNELTCSDQIQQILINSRKQNTRHTYP